MIQNHSIFKHRQDKSNDENCFRHELEAERLSFSYATIITKQEISLGNNEKRTNQPGLNEHLLHFNRNGNIKSNLPEIN